MFHEVKCDYIKFTGKDRLDLLHRLSTNDIAKLGEYCGTKTILTTDKGRIVDLLTIYSFPGFLFVTCSPGNAPNIIRHLDKYTIMEDFKPENMSGRYETVLVFGEGSETMCREVFGVDLSEKKDNDFSIVKMGERSQTPFGNENTSGEIGGVDVLVGRNDDKMGGFIVIFGPEKTSSPLPPSSRESLREKGENEIWEKIKTCGNEIGDEEYEALRIKAGIPKFGNEMSEGVNPLECNLGRYVSFTKGCYIGQEVIARLDTYDKVSKHLVGITHPALRAPLQRGDLIVTDTGHECGYITSTAKDIGLGFVKTAFLDFEKKYRIGNGIEVRLVNLATN
jgi:folate-binding protein YgfZ